MSKFLRSVRRLARPRLLAFAILGARARKLTGERYGELLKRIVFVPDEEPNDVSTALSSAGAWASGAIVSPPQNMNTFTRADLGLTFFAAAQQREQMPFWPGGESSPPGPGKNSPARLRSVQAAAVIALLGK